MTKIFLKFWPLYLIVGFTVLLRIWRIEELFYFTYDEAVPALIGRRLVLTHHVPLIGGVTPFGFHLGPYFYWFYSALLFLGKFNPIIWGYISALIAAITTLLMFRLGNMLGNKKVAISASIFWAFSFLTNLYDRHLWALYWGPLASLLTIIALSKIAKGKSNYIFLLVATIALAIHADPSNLVFLALTALTWIIFKQPITKKTLLAFSFIPITFLPLLVFDLRHDFANTKPVLEFINRGENKPSLEKEKFVQNSLLFPRVFTRTLYTFSPDGDISKQYSYCRNFVQEKFQAIPSIFVFAALLILLSFTWWATRFSKSEVAKIMAILMILYFLGIQIYGTIFRADIFEHYITGAIPIFVVISALLISKLPRKIWLITIAIFVLANLYKIFNAYHSHGLLAKRQAIQFVTNEIGNDAFSLESLSTCWRLSGYRYLFAAYGREPVKSYVDPSLSYLYTVSVQGKHPSLVAAMIIHSENESQDFYDRYHLFKSFQIKNAYFSNIEVIILDNQSGWFDKF